MPLLDLHGLKSYLVRLKFYMVSLVSLIPTLYLKDAYFHIAIFEGHRYYLHFVVDPNSYQFAVLLFGLVTAGQVFTKCMLVVAAHLR